MRRARSAKVYATLGATLIAMNMPNITFAEANKSSANGISGADVLGISGADIQGISGADGLGISGGDALGISGGDALGISGGDALGISGGDVLGISGGDALGISGGDALGISGGDRLMLAGPINSVDRINGVFESMGQIVMASQSMLSGMRVGDFVTVNGSVIASGWLYADAVSVSADRYVPGSTEVFVSGMLSSINTLNGTAQMGGLTIDYTPSLGSSAVPSDVMWSFRGTRPNTQGSARTLANALRISSPAT